YRASAAWTRPSRHPKPSAQALDDGVQDQAHAGADHGAVDADVLQVAAEQQFELVRRLGGVPALDGPGDQAGQLVVEVVDEGPDARLDHAVQAVGEAAVRAEAPPGRGQQVGQPTAQLGLRVGGLGAQRVLGLLPQVRGPVPEQRAAQHVAFQALPALAQVRIGFQAVREPGQPRVELTAGLVAGIGGHGDQALAQPGVQPVEDPAVDRVGYPARGLALEQLTQLGLVVAEIAFGG